MLPKAFFLLDIEVELTWGTIDEEINKEKVRRASEKVRACLDNILDVLDKYKIPVTWGILGHVMLDHCKCVSGAPHPEMPRAPYKWMKRDWYKYDPCGKLADEPAFYGKDITDELINYASKTKVQHDFASHSFSHQLFGDPDCSEEVAEAEIRRCIKLMKENYGLTPKVFIFPRDHPGHLKTLRKNDFIAFRGPIPRTITYAESGKGIWNSARKYTSLTSYLASFYLAMPPPVVSPKEEQGLINIPASMCYNKKRFIPLRLITLKAKKGITRAIRERKLFHLYTHLMNFGEATNTTEFLKGFEEVLAYADSQRRENKIEITTMKNIAEIYKDYKPRNTKNLRE